MSSAAGYDLAVVGSGIVGLGHALAASRRGLRVVVIDRSAGIVGASVRNFGHLCFTAQSGRSRTFAIASRSSWLRLAADAGVWLRESGTDVVARHPDEGAILAEFAHARSGASAFRPSAATGTRSEVELLGAAAIEDSVPIARGNSVGGAHLPFDLQVDPRQAASAIVAHLAHNGVEFRFRTAVTGVRSGRVDTARGPVHADRVVVAVNHDIDELYPQVAERVGIRRCSLDMLRVEAALRGPLRAPLLTGWSLVRYAAFAGLPSAPALAARLHDEQPELAALDLNQMYTQLPDGSLIVGDTHHRGDAASPFQNEQAFEVLLGLTTELFGVTAPRVLERWQGVYASGPSDFLIDEPEPGVHLVAATTGIGMTIGFGLAEHVLAAAFDEPESPSDHQPSNENPHHERHSMSTHDQTTIGESAEPTELDEPGETTELDERARFARRAEPAESFARGDDEEDDDGDDGDDGDDEFDEKPDEVNDYDDSTGEWGAQALNLDGVDVELVVLDMAGTTVRDDGLVERAFQLAARRTGIADTQDGLDEALEYVRETMGQSKIEVFRALTDTEHAAERANVAFESAYAELVEERGVVAIEGAEEVIRELRAADVKVVLATGFSRTTQDAVLDALDWHELADATLSPAEAGRGRPFPDLPLTALLRTGTTSVGAMVVVGDTAADMLSGVHAGAGLIVGVRSGTHDEEILEESGADVVIDSIADLPDLLGLR